MKKETKFEFMVSDNGKTYSGSFDGEVAETLATHLFPNFLQGGFARRIGSLMDDVCYDDCERKREPRVKADDETKLREKRDKASKVCDETVVVDDMSDDTSCEGDGCACTDEANRDGKMLKETCRCHDSRSERGNVNVARDASRKVSVIERYARAAREVMDAANGILDKDCLLKLLEEKVSEDFVSPELLNTVGLTARDVARKAIHALVDREVLEWRNLLVTRKGYTRLVRMFSEFLSQRVSENLFNTPMNIGCTYPKTWDRY